MSSHDGFLVCCYSQHPLVTLLRREITARKQRGKVVTGIFEASISSSLQAINVDEQFGIVSTGYQWIEILNDAVMEALGSTSSSRYVGVETTGLDANELHTAAEADLEKRMAAAARRLLQRNAKAICLGCAGMAGMDRVVRSACVAELGVEEGERIVIVDGVVAGVIWLEGMLRTTKHGDDLQMPVHP